MVAIFHAFPCASFSALRRQCPSYGKVAAVLAPWTQLRVHSPLHAPFSPQSGAALLLAVAGQPTCYSALTPPIICPLAMAAYAVIVKVRFCWPTCCAARMVCLSCIYAPQQPSPRSARPHDVQRAHTRRRACHTPPSRRRGTPLAHMLCSARMRDGAPDEPPIMAPARSSSLSLSGSYSMPGSATAPDPQPPWMQSDGWIAISVQVGGVDQSLSLDFSQAQVTVTETYYSSASPLFELHVPKSSWLLQPSWLQQFPFAAPILVATVSFPTPAPRTLHFVNDTHHVQP